MMTPDQRFRPGDRPRIDCGRFSSMGLSTGEIARVLFEDLLPIELGGDYGRLRTNPLLSVVEFLASREISRQAKCIHQIIIKPLCCLKRGFCPRCTLVATVSAICWPWASRYQATHDPRKLHGDRGFHLPLPGCQGRVALG